MVKNNAALALYGIARRSNAGRHPQEKQKTDPNQNSKPV